MKYFVISDIHGFFYEMKSALDEAGYNPQNKNHTLIVLGDVFDRGLEAKSVYEYLISIPKERLILIKGNHESLLKAAIKRGDFTSYDYSNKTFNTIFRFTKYGKWDNYKNYSDIEQKEEFEINKEICNDFKKQPVWKWLNSKDWVNYYETDKFIFVHSWIPFEKPKIEIEDENIIEKLVLNDKLKYRRDWKRGTKADWQEATWVNPWILTKLGLNKTGKTIVCGHWSACDFHIELENQTEINHDIYFSKDCIAIDACTVLSRTCNVLIIDENNVCYNKQHRKLGEV